MDRGAWPQPLLAAEGLLKGRALAPKPWSGSGQSFTAGKN